MTDHRYLMIQVVMNFQAGRNAVRVIPLPTFYLDVHQLGIIMNDQLFQMGFDAIGGDLGCGDSWKFYSPEGLDYGSYSVSNVGCWEYKSYPIYVANTLCNNNLLKGKYYCTVF